MKMRHGFVSNSSSSSYIVKIRKITYPELISQIYPEYSYDYFDLKKIKQEILKRIIISKKFKREAEETKKNHPDKKVFGCDWVDGEIERLIKLREEISIITEPSDIVDLVFRYRGIKCYKHKWGLELSCFTAMHNSFNEGADELFREIIQFFLFDTKYKLQFERECDG